MNIRKTATVVAILLAGTAVSHAQLGGNAQQQAAQAAAEAGYTQLQIDDQYLHLSIPGHTMGETMGVATNSKGHLFVYSRTGKGGIARGGTAAMLFEFDQNNKFVKEIDPDSYGASFAHAVRVDKDDNIWSVDEGSGMVVKHTPQGMHEFWLGRVPEAIDYLEANLEPLKYNRLKPMMPGKPVGRMGEFDRETDIAWDSKGNSYISDGYGNSRFVKISPDGHWLKAVGTFGSGKDQFNTPHTIAADAEDNIYVGDRGNGRIQVFDNHGKFIRILNQAADVTLPNDIHAIRQPPAPSATPPANKTISPGAPWAICISPPNKAGEQFLFSSDSYPGRIYKMKLDGTVVGTIGAAGKELGHFGDIHELACPTDNLLYAGEELNWRVSKIVIHP